MEFYDLCIVGAGMIGSCAARHATLLKQSVCLIGPEEPKCRQGHEIFGAHYDEGRITRSTATESSVAILAIRSIARYRQLEQETGIKFYQEVGCLSVGDPTSKYFCGTLDSVKQQNLDVKLMSSVEIRSKFPYLATIDSHHAIFETKDAGYIRPRHLCMAEQTAAKNRGCHIIREIVNSVVTLTPEGHADPLVKVTTDNRTTIMAKKVLLATGAFTDFRPILPKGLKLDLMPVTQSVVFAELSPEDQHKMRDMPSILTKYVKLSTSTNEDDPTSSYDCYILPPIKYPDGKVYLKLGHGDAFEIPLKSPTEIKEWYHGSVPKDWEDGLKQILKLRFPGLNPISFHTDTCATVSTPTGRPYIDLVSPQLGIALGDNGYCAKLCDEVGRLAAELVVKGRWEDDLPRDEFRMVMRTSHDSSRL